MLEYIIGMSILGIMSAFGLMFSAFSVWPSGFWGMPKDVEGGTRLTGLVMGLAFLAASYALAGHFAV